MIEYLLLPILTSFLATVLWFYREHVLNGLKWMGNPLLTAMFGVKIHNSWNLSMVHQKLHSATKRVFILQTWFPQWQREHKAWEALMENLHNTVSTQDFSMKVLLLDPNLYHARLRARGDLKTIHVGGISMFSTEQQGELREFIQRYSSGKIEIEVALYNSLPFGPIYVIDDVVYWGLFVSDKDSMKSVCFQASVKSRIGEVILKSFENAWRARSSVLEPTLSPKEIRNRELEAARIFNELRDKFANFKLLGRIRVDNPTDDSPDMQVTQCIRHCLRSGVPTLVIMRHAATSLNEAGIFSGLLPVRLSENGKKQIKQLLAILPNLRDTTWTRTCCSTVARTKETLELLLQNAGKIIPRRELDERNIGKLEGDLKAQVEQAKDDRRNCWKFFWEPSCGESYARLLTRIHQSKFLEEITEGLLGDRNILVCTHEGPLKIIRMILESPKEIESSDLDKIDSIDIRNCDLYVYIDAAEIENSDNEDIILECLKNSMAIQLK